MADLPNIVLLTVDSLRADHLGCYGYHLETSPRCDAFAAQGTLCERLYDCAIPTHPAYTTLYTGQHALTHNIVAINGPARLAQETPVLPELLLEAGYVTCAVDNLWRWHRWFGQGYEYYIDPSVRHNIPSGVRCEALNERAVHWLRTRPDGPFFLFMHYWDTHAPYVAPQRYGHLFYDGDPVDPANHSLDGAWRHPVGMMARETWLRTPRGVATDADYVRALYDREVRYVDDGIGAMLDALVDLDLVENTLVLVMADHGESIAEHGVFFEHYGLYDCTVRVPFMMRWPGRVPAGRRLSQMLHNTDIAPTILDAVGLPIPPSMEGRSSWPLVADARNDGGHDSVISLECSYQAQWSLRTSSYLYILSREQDFAGNPLRELYDLSQDPAEKRNIAEEHPQVAQAFEGQLEDWIAERLRALGRDDDPLREQGISLRHELEELA
jgi:arylsulfatase A-like enzyme